MSVVVPQSTHDIVAGKSVPVPIPHVARKSQNYPGSNYLLPADEQERERLITQHHMLTKAFGKQLLPPLNPDEIQHVLDSGTGAGIWITELAKQVPSTATLHGIDIELALVPSTPPPNLSFSLNTITKLPSEWTGRFDLVHQRFLMGALRKAEWVSAIAEMYRVLRPGGWVQLLEGSDFMLGSRCQTGCQATLQLLIQQLHLHRDLLVPCANHVPQLLEEAGFINLTVERRYFPLGRAGGEVGATHAYTLGGVYRGMKTPILRAGGLGIIDSEKAYDELLEAVENEWHNHAGNGTHYFAIVAQKPDAAT